MAELYDVVRTIVQDVVKNMDPTGISPATVISVSPLALEIQASTLRVEEPVAMLTDAVVYRSVEIEGQTVVINPGLVPGDKVLTIKANGGQNYIVISKA